MCDDNRSTRNFQTVNRCCFSSDSILFCNLEQFLPAFGDCDGFSRMWLKKNTSPHINTYKNMFESLISTHSTHRIFLHLSSFCPIGCSEWYYASQSYPSTLFQLLQSICLFLPNEFVCIHSENRTTRPLTQTPHLSCSWKVHTPIKETTPLEDSRELMLIHSFDLQKVFSISSFSKLGKELVPQVVWRTLISKDSNFGKPISIP